jgi:hypothetical protein
MQDDFFDDFEEEEEEVPDWMGGIDSDDDGDGTSDEFDMLRRKSARAGSAYEDLPQDEFANSGSSGFSLQGLTPTQRLIIALLVLLFVIVSGIGVILLIT